MMVAFFAIIYVLININQLKNKYIIKSLAINLIFILCLTSFFLVPLIETKQSTDYIVYEAGMMSDIELIESQALSINELFAAPTEDRVVFELGPHIIIMLVFSIMAYKKLKEIKLEYIFFLISGFICLWMTTKYFPWRILPKAFYMIQFPWRMLQMAGFFFAIICSINMEQVIKNYRKLDTIIIIAISLLYVISLYSHIPYLEDKISNIEDWKLGEMSGKEYEVVARNSKSRVFT